MTVQLTEQDIKDLLLEGHSMDEIQGAVGEIEKQEQREQQEMSPLQILRLKRSRKVVNAITVELLRVLVP